MRVVTSSLKNINMISKEKNLLSLFQVHNVEDLLKDKMKDINLTNY